MFTFFSKHSKEKEERMEIDFIIPKSKITNRHNINVIEVKSGKNYTLNSINKFKNKYSNYVNSLYVIHSSNLKIENDIIYLPIYMTLLI